MKDRFSVGGQITNYTCTKYGDNDAPYNCGDDGIFWGPAPGQDLSYDVNDDSSYTFRVAEDGGSCGYETEFEFTLTR